MREELEQLIRVQIGAGALSARLTLGPGLRASELEPTTVLAFVRGRVAITAGVEAAVTRAIELARGAPDQPVDVHLCAGRPPRHGIDGRVEIEPRWLRDARDSRPGVDADAGIDHYRSSISTIKPGQRIGRVHGAQVGEDGIDVTGKCIPARPAVAAALAFDGSVRLTPDGELLAVRPGIVDWDPPRLRVLNVLDISSDVDFSIGHVHFDGDVRIAGGVKDRFVVHATGSVRVQQLVEAASIDAGLDAELAGGMAGREIGTLRAGRSVHAHYLDNVRADITRDLIVDAELINCQCVVGGRLLCPGGALSGGTYVVGRAVEVAQLGALVGTPTRLALGRAADAERVLDQGAAALAEIEHRLEEAEQRRVQITALGKRGAGALGAPRELASLDAEVAALQGKRAQLVARLEQLRIGRDRRIDATLSVSAHLCAGVVLYIGRFVVEFTRSIRGPVRIFASHSALGFAEPALTDLASARTSPLSEHARVRRHDAYQGPTLTPIPPVADPPAGVARAA